MRPPLRAEWGHPIFTVALRPNLPASVVSGSPKPVTINIIDDAPLPTVSLSVSPRNSVTEGGHVTVNVLLSRSVYADVPIPVTYAPDDDDGYLGPAESSDYSGPSEVTITGRRSVDSGAITIPGGRRRPRIGGVQGVPGHDLGPAGPGTGAVRRAHRPDEGVRNDPRWNDDRSHTDRWDRALLAFDETVED